MNNVISKDEFKEKVSLIYQIYEKKLTTPRKTSSNTPLKRHKSYISPLYRIEFFDKERESNPLDVNIEFPKDSFKEAIKECEINFVNKVDALNDPIEKKTEELIDSEDDGNVTTDDSDENEIIDSEDDGNVTTDDSDEEEEQERNY